MDENEKIEEIKTLILSKVRTSLKCINETSPFESCRDCQYNRDVQNSIVVKNLIEAYTNLSEGDELL